MMMVLGEVRRALRAVHLAGGGATKLDSSCVDQAGGYNRTDQKQMAVTLSDGRDPANNDFLTGGPAVARCGSRLLAAVPPMIVSVASPRRPRCDHLIAITSRMRVGAELLLLGDCRIWIAGHITNALRV